MIEDARCGSVPVRAARVGGTLAESVHPGDGVRLEASDFGRATSG